MMKTVWHRRTAMCLVAALGILLSPLPLRAQTGTLPVLHIHTDGGKTVTSKVIYLPATYYLENADENLGSADAPLPLEIRGRGHSSWKGTKKPYKLKLGKKAPLLGMAKHKHWALLKFNEATLAGMELGRLMGMDWTPSVRPVEVVLNDDFLGLYFLSETNRISKERLDIYKQPNRNEDVETIDGGWLVEVDNYYETQSISIRENANLTMRITLHSPDTLSDKQQSWLTYAITSMNSAIYDTDKEHSTWEEMMDVEAMARFFIVQEVLDNTDGFHGSFYLHKDLGPDTRWVAGPLWDLACNQRTKTDYTFRMKASYGFTPHWIGELIKDEDFCQAVRREWSKFYPHKVEQWMDYITRHLAFDAAYEAEKRRWSSTDTQTLTQRVEKLEGWLRKNIQWFNNHLPGDPSAVDDPLADDSPVIVYTLQGVKLREAPSLRQALQDLPQGIYIINGRKVQLR